VTVHGGASAKNGWKVSWTFPGSQKITNLWDGQFTQSGAQVTVTNMPYNAQVPAGGTVSFGFTANGTSAAPASLTCT
jgi:cellulase/cellobiase CelA1